MREPARAARGVLVVVAVFTVLLALPGCDGGVPESGEAVFRRDSAGIEIVENTRPAWRDGDGWRIARRAAFSIGSLEAEPDYEFEKIRDIAVMPDGVILVSDEGAHSVRAYGPDGVWLATMGGMGEGPGELGWIWGTGPFRGDSVWIYDYQRVAVSIFGPSPDFSYARQVSTLISPRENLWVVSTFDDGRFLLYSPGHARIEGPPGLRYDSTLVVAVDPSGAPVDTLTRAQLSQKVVRSNGSSGTVHLSANSVIDASGSQLYIVEGERVEYRIHSRTGDLARIVRREAGVVPVTDAVKSRYVDAYVERATGDPYHGTTPDQVRRDLEASDDWAETVPSVARLVIDDEEHVWLGRYDFGRPSRSWEVFDPDGRWLGVVDTPERLEVMAVANGMVVGIFTDEYGLQYVRGHRLRR